MNGLAPIMMMAIIVIVIIGIFGKNRKKVIFDEMQLKTRNKGYRYSFLTLLLYNSIYSLLESAFDIIIFDSFATTSFIGLLISIFVFSFICIKENAYLSFTDNIKNKVILFFILGVLNIATSVMDCLAGNWVKDGLLTFNICIPILSLMMIFLAIYLLIKTTKNEIEDEEE